MSPTVVQDPRGSDDSNRDPDVRPRDGVVAPTVIDHASKRFDAPRADSAVGSAMKLARTRWRMCVALTMIASLVELLAAGVVSVDAVGARAIDATIGSISMLVAVDPQAPQADVDALGPLIRAKPGVAAAILRPKDDALRALIAKGMPPAEGRNPLPDVWAARFDPAALGPDRSVTSAIAEARRALAMLPRVESVTTDEAWVRSTDRWVERWRTARPLVGAASLAVLTLLLACAASLGGGSLIDVSPAVSKRVLALLACAVVLLSATIGFSVDWMLLERLNIGQGGTLQLDLGQVLAGRSDILVGIVTLSCLILAGGLMVGARHQK